jgi:hypothetical protein
MFCKKLCCDITIRLVTINFQRCTSYSVTPCIKIGDDRLLPHSSEFIIPSTDVDIADSTWDTASGHMRWMIWFRVVFPGGVVGFHLFSFVYAVDWLVARHQSSAPSPHLLWRPATSEYTGNQGLVRRALNLKRFLSVFSIMLKQGMCGVLPPPWLLPTPVPLGSALVNADIYVRSLRLGLAARRQSTNSLIHYPWAHSPQPGDKLQTSYC